MISDKNYYQKNNIKKQNVKTLFSFFRNGTCFSFTWLVIIVLLNSFFNGSESIRTLFLLKTLIFCLAASLFFALVFSKVFLRKCKFIIKLTIFTLCFLPTEIGYFYWIGLFNGRGDIIKWSILVGLIIVLYIICLCIDRLVYAKKGDEYTFMLNEYKKQRSLGKDE